MEEKLENGEQQKMLPEKSLPKIIPKNDKELVRNVELGSPLMQNETTKDPTTPAAIDPDALKSTTRGVFNQIILTCCILLITAASGMPIGYSAVILPQLYNSTDPLAIDVAMGSWIASVHSAATPFGSFASGPMSDYFGRRPTLMFSVLPLIIGWLFIAMAQSHFMILLGRLIAGLAVGLLAAPAKILVAECAEPKLRGLLVGAPFAAYSVGILIVYALGPFMNWRTVAWCGLILPVASFIAIGLTYESPVWLARKNKWDQAKKALTWLRGGDEYAKVEFDQLKVRLQNERESNELNHRKENESFFVLIRKPTVLKPIIIINGFNLLQTISGTYIVVFYAVDIIKEFGADVDPTQTAIITALDRLLFTFLFCYLLYKITRRSTVIISGLISGASCFVLSAYLVIRRGEPKSMLDLYIAAACMIVYVSANTGFMTLPGVLIGELLPANIRGRYGGYVFAFFNLCVFGFAKIFPHIQPDLGSAGTFFVFGLGSFGAALLMYLILPETKNRTLHEIEDYFQGDNWLWAKRDKNIQIYDKK